MRIVKKVRLYMYYYSYIELNKHLKIPKHGKTRANWYFLYFYKPKKKGI